MKKISLTIALTLLLISVLYGAAGWYFASVLVDFPGRPLEDDRKNLNIAGPWQFGLPAPEAFDLRSHEVLLKGWLFRNERSPARCGVVASHGHSGTRYGGLKYARLFFERGCHAVVFDARHHGESSGAFGTYGFFEKHDLARVVRQFATRVNLPLARVGIIGESMGGAISLQAAPLLPQIAFVAADSAFASAGPTFRQRAIDLYGEPVRLLFPLAQFLGEARSGADFSRVTPAASAREISVPVFLAHSLSDTEIPPDNSREIFAAIPHERKHLYLSGSGAAHGRSVDTDLAAYRREIDFFLKRFVPGF